MFDQKKRAKAFEIMRLMPCKANLKSPTTECVFSKVKSLSVFSKDLGL